MELFLKFDYRRSCNLLLEYQLNKMGLEYTIHGLNKITFKKNLSPEERKELQELLSLFKIEILIDQKMELIEQIKLAIDEMLQDEKAVRFNTSDYLADRLNYSYSYLSNLFSEVTYASIEQYIILRKVDFVKEFLIKEKLTLTEIAYRLNYSSVAHLSGQFKKTTGLTPSAFQRIIEKRNLKK